MCNRYSNVNPPLLKRHANNCPAFRARLSAVPAATTTTATAMAIPDIPIVSAAVAPVPAEAAASNVWNTVANTVPSLLPSAATVAVNAPTVPSLEPSAPAVATNTPAVPSLEPPPASAVDDDATTEAENENVDSVKAESENVDSAAAGSTQQSEPVQLDTTVYNLDYQSIGMVVHLQSGSVICIHCRSAVLIENVVAHFNRNHNLNRWILRRTIDRCQPGGQTTWVLYEQGLYIAPLVAPLPAISLLEVSSGFVCRFCPVLKFTAVAAFAGTRSSMIKHIQRYHRGLDHGNFTTCYVQHLYNDQRHKVYFAVDRPYSGPTIESTITNEGEALFENFAREHPDYEDGYDPDAAISDSRVVSTFYNYINWFQLVIDVTGEDTNENRIILYNWVNARIPEYSTEVALMDNDLKQLVRKHFNNMQQLMSSSKSSFYHFRILVMQYDSNSATPTKGLTPPQG